MDKENILSSIFPSYEASKELTEHIKTGFDDYDGNTFFDIITAGATALRLNPSTRLFANAPKYIVRGICKLGADFYLRKKKGYTFSADLFEHSLQENPNDLVFYDDSDVSKNLKADENLLNKIDTMVEKIENNIPFDKNEKYYTFYNGDMYYCLFHCNMEIADIKKNEDGTKDITVHINDRYDFTKITSIKKGGPSFGTIANDAALFASWIDSINPYQVDIYFTVRR